MQCVVTSETNILSNAGMIFRKEPFFYGHDNYDQLVKIAKVMILHTSAIIRLCLGFTL